MATESLRNNNKFIDDDYIDDYNRMMIDVSISDFEEDRIDADGYYKPKDYYDAYKNATKTFGIVKPSPSLHNTSMPIVNSWVGTTTNGITIQDALDELAVKPRTESASKLALEVDGLRLRMMEENASDEEVIEMLKRISTYLDPSSRAIMEKVKGLEDGWEDLESDAESE